MPYIYANVFISQHCALAGILYQGKSRARYLYMPKYTRPPGVICQLVYYIRRHLGNATYIYQCLYILALCAGRHTISGEIQGTPPIYANVFAPSQRHTPAGILHQEISRKCRLYMPKYISSWHYVPAGTLYQGKSRVCYLYILMSLYPAIVRRLAHYTKRRLGHTTYIY